MTKEEAMNGIPITKEYAIKWCRKHVSYHYPPVVMARVLRELADALDPPKVEEVREVKP